MPYLKKVRNKYFLIILGIGIILRLISIDQSFWLDEATSGLVVRNLSFTQILTNFSPADFHPPLYYILLKIWSLFFGTGEIALRSLSIIFGIGTIFVTIKIARIFDKRSYLIAGILMATAPLHIYYSQEARMYSMTAFFVTLAMYYQVKKSGSNYLAGILMGLAIMSDYMAVFAIPVVWLMIFLEKKNGSRIKRAIQFHIPLVLAGAIVFPIFIQQFSNAVDVKASGSLWWNILGTFSIKNILLVPIKLVIGRISFENNFVYGAYVTAVFTLLTITIIPVLKSFKKLLFWVTVPVVLAILVSLFVPVLYYFRLLYVLPAIYILMAIGVSSSKHWKLVLTGVLAINVISSSLYLFNDRFHREDWKGFVDHIEQSGPNTQVVFVANSQMEAFDYYNVNELERVGPDGLDIQSDTIWLMRYVHDIYDPSDTTRLSIERLGFTKVNEINFNGVVAWEYENSN